MKKKLLIGAAGLLVAGGLFFSGSIVGANSDWKIAVENDANVRLGRAGHLKKQEIIEKTSDISNQMKDVLDPEIAKQEEELARMLDEYYRLKMQGLSDSNSFKELEEKIEQIKQLQYERYRKDIDTIFNNLK